LAAGSFSNPQAAQGEGNGAPHSAQKRLRRAFSAMHLRQRTWVLELFTLFVDVDVVVANFLSDGATPMQIANFLVLGNRFEIFEDGTLQDVSAFFGLPAGTVLVGLGYRRS
jgi:hypothetical protein